MTKRKIILIIIVLIGILSSIFLFMGVQKLLAVSSQSQFIKDASSYAHAIEMGIQNKLDDLNAVHGLFEASDQVEAREFDAFVKRILHEANQINAIQWLPRQTERDEISLTQSHAFVFHVPAGDYQEESSQEDVFERYAILYSFPSLDAIYPMAPDATMERQMARLFVKARDEGVPKVAIHAHDDPMSVHPYDMDIVWPVYQKDSRIETLQQRRKNLVGFLRSRSELWLILEAQIRTLFTHPGGIDIFLFGKIDQTQRGLIYYHMSLLSGCLIKQNQLLGLVFLIVSFNHIANRLIYRYFLERNN